MEKKTFMRRPLDELCGQNYLELGMTYDKLLVFMCILNVTNHQKKELLWQMYLKRKERGLT